MLKLNYKIENNSEINLTEDSYTTIFQDTSSYGIFHECLIYVDNNDFDLKILYKGKTGNTVVVINDFNMKDNQSLLGNQLDGFKLENNGKTVVFKPYHSIAYYNLFRIDVKSNKNNKKASFYLIRSW